MVHFDELPVRERRHYYQIIYCDAPWSYEFARTKSNGGATYSVMTLDQLKALPVPEICDPKSCVCFMWVTMPKLIEGLELMRSWGFSYATAAFVWIKTNRNNPNQLFSGLGFYTKSNAEICLVGKRGKCPALVDRTVKQVIMAPIRGHSQKPDEVRERINRLFDDSVPRIELFARFVPKNDPSGREESRFIDQWDEFGDGDFGDDGAQIAKRSNSHKNRVYSPSREELSDQDSDQESNYSDYSPTSQYSPRSSTGNALRRGESNRRLKQVYPESSEFDSSEEFM